MTRGRGIARRDGFCPDAAIFVTKTQYTPTLLCHCEEPVFWATWQSPCPNYLGNAKARLPRLLSQARNDEDGKERVLAMTCEGRDPRNNEGEGGPAMTGPRSPYILITSLRSGTHFVSGDVIFRPKGHWSPQRHCEEPVFWATWQSPITDSSTDGNEGTEKRDCFWP